MRIFTPLAAVASLAFFGGSALASFHDSPVRLDVRVASGDSHDRIRGSTASEHNQKKQLEIAVSSVSRPAPAGLSVKWYFFGRDEKSDRVSVLRSGETKLDLAAGAQTVKSDELKNDYTPEHSVVSRGRGGNGGGGRSGGRASVKKVAGEGDRLIGYGVQVLQAGKVVAESFDPPSLKQDVSPIQATNPHPKSK